MAALVVAVLFMPGLEARGQAPDSSSAVASATRYRVNYRAADSAPWQVYAEARTRDKADAIAAEVRQSGYQAEVVSNQNPTPQAYPDASDYSASGYYPTSNWASNYNTYVVPGGGSYNYGWYGGWHPWYRYNVYPGYWWNSGRYWHNGWWRGHGWNHGWNRGYGGWNASHRNWNHSHSDRGSHHTHSEHHAAQAHHGYHPSRMTTGHHSAGHHAAARHAAHAGGEHRGTGHFGHGARTAGHNAAGHRAAGHAVRGHAGGGRHASAGRHAGAHHAAHHDP
jgi:hypothetical protein